MEAETVAELSKTIAQNAEITPEATDRYYAEKYSRGHFQNRLSDLFGVVRSGWVWLLRIVIGLYFVGIIWSVLNGDLNNAASAWGLVFVWLFCIFVSGLLTGLCNLLTGRYPGEAAAVRKAMAEVSE